MNEKEIKKWLRGLRTVQLWPILREHERVNNSFMVNLIRAELKRRRIKGYC